MRAARIVRAFVLATLKPSYMLMGGKAAASGPTAPGVESAWRNTRRIAGQTSLERKKGVLMLLTLVSFAGIAAGVLMTASAALAQGYPERQITMVIPFAAGGPTDTVAA